jgi:hypothetical protein
MSFLFILLLLKARIGIVTLTMTVKTRTRFSIEKSQDRFPFSAVQLHGSEAAASDVVDSIHQHVLQSQSVFVEGKSFDSLLAYAFWFIAGRPRVTARGVLQEPALWIAASTDVEFALFQFQHINELSSRRPQHFLSPLVGNNTLILKNRSNSRSYLLQERPRSLKKEKKMMGMFANIQFPAPRDPEAEEPEAKQDFAPRPRKKRRIEETVRRSPSPPMRHAVDDAAGRAADEHDLKQGDMEREEAAAGGPMPIQYHSLAQIGHDIDWKLLEEQDLKKAEQFAQDKKWDADVFVEPNWCMACHLTATTNKFGINENDPYNDICIYTDRNYAKVGIEVLITTVQEMYMGQLAGCTEQVHYYKFWFRKQIYDHIHTHHRTIRVHNELTLSRNNAIIDHLYKTLLTIDPITGQSMTSYKNADLILKFQAQNILTLKSLESIRSKSMF